MKWILIVFLLFPVQNDFLTELEWNNRVILLFAPSFPDGSVDNQLSSLKEDKAGLNERDLRVFVIDEEGVETMEGQRVINANVEALRAQYNAGKAAFTFILIGKDGGVKLREKYLVDNQKLFSLIDSMPMRRREMKDQK